MTLLHFKNSRIGSTLTVWWFFLSWSRDLSPKAVVGLPDPTEAPTVKITTVLPTGPTSSPSLSPSDEPSLSPSAQPSKSSKKMKSKKTKQPKSSKSQKGKSSKNKISKKY